MGIDVFRGDCCLVRTVSRCLPTRTVAKNHVDRELAIRAKTRLQEPQIEHACLAMGLHTNARNLTITRR